MKHPANLKTINAPRLGVHLWSLLTLVATFFLLCSGGLVTSKGVGMAVPDWPTTYGYNMFLFPISKWVGGIFYEHSHRLIASGVGLMTMILAAWLLAVEPRRWIKILGIAAFLGVCFQGLLGGLRVTLYKDEIGIFHALLAQGFFCLLGIITISTNPQFIAGKWDSFQPDHILKNLVLITTALIFIQLSIGAMMRHEHAGLSIPDFPQAYGKWIPDTSTEALLAINKQRIENGEVPTTAFFIWVQMTHRLVAILIFLGVGTVVWRTFNQTNPRSTRLWGLIWLTLIFAQIVLGAWTIWSNKAADIATTHMALGALTLFLGVILTFRLCRGVQANRFTIPDPTSPNFLSRTA